jgi:hypothetical protein
MSTVLTPAATATALPSLPAIGAALAAGRATDCM